MKPKNKPIIIPLALRLACVLAGVIIGIAIFQGLSNPEQQPQPGASGACRGLACPTPTASDQSGDDPKIAAAWNAAAAKCPKNADGTLLYKCIDFAKLFVKELANRGLTGKVITIQGAFGSMVSSRWKNSTEVITGDGGPHRGVEVNGKVYDNLKFDGLPIEIWRRTFEAILNYDPNTSETTLGPPPIVPNR